MSNTDIQIKLGVFGWLRWGWRQLTSMTTALWLLLLLGLAAIPGSILPQRSASLIRVNDFKENNPQLFEFYDSLGLFDVYASIWFSAIYILLMTSLAGCIIPRMKVHGKNIVEAIQPPPKILDNQQSYRLITTTDDLQTVKTLAKRKGWRTKLSEDETELTLEKGYLRETGNLLFHIAIFFITIAVAFGALFNYRGTILLIEENSFANTLTQYDDFRAGGLFSVERMPEFSFRLDNFEVEFERGPNQTGSPREFIADLTVTAQDEIFQQTVVVNKPLVIDGTKAFLTGHGYAPHIRVYDPTGEIIFDRAIPFLPQDGSFTSNGVVKIPDATEQLGLLGLFLPTGALDPQLGPISVFPDLDNPLVFFSAWTGDLGMDSGVAQNVYRLDTDDLTQIGLAQMAIGDSWRLSNDFVVEFVDVKRFASFQIAYDPGRIWAFIASVLAMIGLIYGLFVRRRRIWFRVNSQTDKIQEVAIAGFSKQSEEQLNQDMEALVSKLKAGK